jgi:hypothetical protein
MVYRSVSADYRARIEVYAGRGKRMVCEWNVEWDANPRTDYGICYGLVEARREVERAIAHHGFAEAAKKEKVK